MSGEGKGSTDRVVAVAGGSAHAAAVTEKGEIFFWGGRNWFSPHLATNFLKDSGGSGAIDVVCGGNFSVALTKHGEIFSWSKAGYGGQTPALGHELTGLTSKMSGTSAVANPKRIESAAVDGMRIRGVGAGKDYAFAF